MVFLDWKEFPCNGGTATPSGVRDAGGRRARGLAFVFRLLRLPFAGQGVYLSIITQALTFAAMLLFFRNATGFGGNNGFTDFRRILDIPIATPQTRMALFAITGATLIGTLLLARWLTTSRFGRVLAAIRDAEQRVMFCGYDTVHYKLFVWTLSAVICGIAGALTFRSRIITGEMSPGIRSRSRSGSRRRPRTLMADPRRGLVMRESCLHPAFPEYGRTRRLSHPRDPVLPGGQAC